MLQKEIALEIGINPSLISRAIKNRSIEICTGEEKPIKYFFCNEKQINKELIRKFTENRKHPLTDEGIRIKLRKQFDIELSRTSINKYRKELKIPSSFRKAQ